MRIVLTNRQAIEIINAFSSLENKVLPMKLSFAVGKNLDKIQTVIYKPYQKQFEKLKNNHAVLDENGNQKVDEYKRLIFNERIEYEERLNELLDIENEIEVHAITEKLLEQCETDEKYSDLTMKEQVALMKFIEG